VRRSQAAAILGRFARRSLARLHRVEQAYEAHRRRVLAAVKIQRAWRTFLEIRDESEEAAMEVQSQGSSPTPRHYWHRQASRSPSPSSYTSLM
jgi:hypothetical protein